MTRHKAAWAVGLALLGSVPAARGQATTNPNQVAAKVERATLVLSPPDRYRLSLVLEPSRRVEVMAQADNVLRGIAVPIGSTVREGQEIARLDAVAAMARLKIAMAEVKEKEAELAGMKLTDSASGASKGPGYAAIGEARLDAARARAELAQMEVEGCILRAPFAGRITAIYVSPGQYLAKGTPILEIDDLSSLRVLLPVDRTAATAGGTVNLMIEGAGVSGRVRAVLPLPESQAVLRELATPLAAAWVTVANPSGALESGQRVQSPFLPNAPIAGVASYALQKDEAGGQLVQVIRAERVTDVPIRVLGVLGPDRVQVSGAFRASDVLIQTSNVPLRAGTFIRFNDAPAGRVEGQPPAADQVGEPAEVSLPPGVAPIGSGGRAARPPARPGQPAARPSTGGGVPF